MIDFAPAVFPGRMYFWFGKNGGETLITVFWSVWRRFNGGGRCWQAIMIDTSCHSSSMLPGRNISHRFCYVQGGFFEQIQTVACRSPATTYGL